MADETAWDNWPTGTDLSAFLTSTQVPLGDDAATVLNLDLHAAAAAKDFNRLTGWSSFLARQATLTFDPPSEDGGKLRLNLGTGLLSLTNTTGSPSNTIMTGIGPDTPQGRILTLGQDFWLRPNNAPAYDYPWTSIEFRGPQFGLPQSIQISGLFGFCQTLPADVFRAVLMQAAAQVAPQLALNISKGLYEWRRGDEMERYGGSADAGPLASQINLWTSTFRATAAHPDYQRTSIS